MRTMQELRDEAADRLSPREQRPMPRASSRQCVGHAEDILRRRNEGSCPGDARGERVEPIRHMLEVLVAYRVSV